MRIINMCRLVPACGSQQSWLCLSEILLARKKLKGLVHRPWIHWQSQAFFRAPRHSKTLAKGQFAAAVCKANIFIVQRQTVFHSWWPPSSAKVSMLWANSESYKAHKIIFVRTEFVTLLQNSLHSIILNTQTFRQRIVGVGGFVGMAVGIPNQFHLGPFCQTVKLSKMPSMSSRWPGVGQVLAGAVELEWIVTKTMVITIFCIPSFQMLCFISLDQTSFNMF